MALGRRSGRPQPGGVRGSGIGGCVDVGAARAGADHQACAQPHRGLLPPADAEHLASPTTRAKGGGLEGVQRRPASTRARSSIRGGTHYEFSWIRTPGVPGSSLRGADLDHVVHDGVVRRLRQGRRERCSGACCTDRWRADAPSAAVDPDKRCRHDVAPYYRSRLDIGRRGESGSSATTCGPAARGCSPTTARVRTTTTSRS